MNFARDGVLHSQRCSPRVFIHEAVLPETARLLRTGTFSNRGRERVVYWAGKDIGSSWIVSTCIAPRATTAAGSFEVSAESNARVVMLLNELELVLLAQIHTHPGAWVGHSNGDNDGAFMPYEDFISIVVPSYARGGIWPLHMCGVHRFRGRVFLRLNKAEVERDFRLLPTSCNLRKS
jgi:hypothetical protein